MAAVRGIIQQCSAIITQKNFATVNADDMLKNLVKPEKFFTWSRILDVW